MRGNGAVKYYTVDSFENTGRVKTCFSTRIGGVSTGGYHALNTGLKSGDDILNIRRNIDLLCYAAGFNTENMVFSDQVHGNNVRIAGREDIGKGAVRSSDIRQVDALVTGDKNTAICIFTADCIPVFLYDFERNVAALCHAGWRGIINGIIAKTIDIMSSSFNSNPCCIKAAIGPSIGPCCFEVGEDVAGVFKMHFKDTEGILLYSGGKSFINLQSAARKQLMGSGVRDNNIIESGLCTSCNDNMFFSYRRDGSKTGRMISIMELI